MGVSNDAAANSSARQVAAAPSHPVSAKEVADEMARLRELARRIRIHPRNAIRYATQWLHPPENATAAIDRWYMRHPDSPTVGDLLDALMLLEAIARGEIGHAETAAAQLEFFAEILEPQLRRWLIEIQTAALANQPASVKESLLVQVNEVASEGVPEALISNPVGAMIYAGSIIEKAAAGFAWNESHNDWTVLQERERHRLLAEHWRNTSLLLQVVDDAAVAVVASGGDPAPLFAIAEIASRGNVDEFSQQWPAVAVILRTAEAKRKAAASVSAADDAQAPVDPIGEVGDKGVSLSDIGTALGCVDEDLRDFVRRFGASKRITSVPLGKCPKDRRANLYGLLEILADFESFSPLGKTETITIRKHLQSVARLPAK